MPSSLLSARLLCILFATFIITLQVQAQPDVQYQPLIPASAGLAAPMEVVTAPGDNTRLFIVEKAGRIMIWDGDEVLATPFLNITGIVADDGERGLLSLAFHPQYQSNGYFFVYYNNNSGNIVVARYQVSANPDVANPTATTGSPLISIPKNFSNHNGGHLQFRTEGGTPYLYFATGDGGSGNDPDYNAQNPASWLGKMIRVNVDVVPFVPERWGWGLRNPFRWSFDRTTGDMWIGDVGQDSKEEINFRAGGTWGANYGWVCVEGTENNSSAPVSNAICDTVRAVDLLPIFDYDNPVEGQSVVGGYVYRGSEFADLQGYYLATDYYSGRLWRIRPAGGGTWDISVKTGMATGISSISEGNDGTLYAVSLNTGAIFKIVTPIVTPVRLITFAGKQWTGYNELKWSVEESNISRYVVEYSLDGRTYTDAGEVTPVNNPGRNNYTYRHQYTSAAPVYYRLRMEENSAVKYSPVIVIRSDKLGDVRVYPATISNGIININSPRPVNTVQLASADGRVIMTKQLNGTEGYFILQAPSVNKGVYFVVIIGSDFRQTEKVIFQ